MHSKALRAPALGLLRFISQVMVSDTLLVVSILEMVYDCRFWPLLQSWRDLYWLLWELWILFSLGLVFSGSWERWGDYNGSCGDYGSFSVLNGPLQAVGEPVGCLQGSVTHCLALPRFLEFILLFSFSGTLLVVLISGIVYACSLWLLLWFGWGGVMVPVGAIGSFRPGGQTFWAVVEPRGCVQSWHLGSCPSLTFRGLSCWSASVILYM